MGCSGGAFRGLLLPAAFATARGRMVRSILYPKPLDLKFYADSLKFLGGLGVIGKKGRGREERGEEGRRGKERGEEGRRGERKGGEGRGGKERGEEGRRGERKGGEGRGGKERREGDGIRGGEKGWL